METLIDAIKEPWPWYIGGPMISVVVLLLLFLGNKSFGVSNSLRTMCSMGGAGSNCSFFAFDWKQQSWNLLFIGGIAIGAFLASTFLTEDPSVAINPATQAELEALGVKDFSNYLPGGLFSFENLATGQGLIMLVLGGFFVGFGSRYAGGCTSGHGIMGLSNLQPASLLAVVGFFIGGLFITHLIYPLIF